jgi:hypothetical protein
MRRDTALRLRVPQSRTSMYAPVGILAAPCLARILLCFTQVRWRCGIRVEQTPQNILSFKQQYKDYYD